MKKGKSVIHNLYIVQHIVDLMLNTELKDKYAMDFAEFIVLYGIVVKDNPSQEDLRCMVGYTPAGMSKLVSILEKQGKLFKVINPKNKRAHVLVIENKTKVKVVNIAKEIEKNFTKHLTNIPPDVRLKLPEYLLSIFMSINNQYKFYSHSSSIV